MIGVVVAVETMEDVLGVVEVVGVKDGDREVVVDEREDAEEVVVAMIDEFVGNQKGD